MALPASLSTVTVIGTYVDLQGNPVRGSLIITPQTILKETAANVIIIPVKIQKTFDATGSFSVVLPVTSDTDVAPIPFIYTLEENFSGGRTFQISLPYRLPEPRKTLLTCFQRFLQPNPVMLQLTNMLLFRLDTQPRITPRSLLLMLKIMRRTRNSTLRRRLPRLQRYLITIPASSC